MDNFGSIRLLKMKVYNRAYYFLNLKHLEEVLCDPKIPLLWNHPDAETMDPHNHETIGNVGDIHFIQDDDSKFVDGFYEMTGLTEGMKRVLSEMEERGPINVSVEFYWEEDDAKYDYWKNCYMVKKIHLTGVAIVRHGACSPTDGCALK